MSLLPRIDRFLRETAMPPTTFGRRAVNDPHLVEDLRDGRRIGPRLTARIERFLAAPR